MKLKLSHKVSAIMTVILFSFPTQSFTKPIEVTAKSSARVSFITGNLYSVQKNKLIKLSKGYIVKVNSHLKTDKKSKAEIIFSDGSRVRLSENTDITLVKTRNNDNHGFFKMLSGRLWANITQKTKNRFAVQGKTATLAVLGTTFDIEVEKNKTDISVFEGSVGVQLPDQDINNFDNKLDKLKLNIDDNKESTKIQKPDKIDKPVQEIEKPFKVIEGPHKVSKEEWLEIVDNQKISVDNKGLGIVSELKPEEIKEDEWIQWNKTLDSKSSENMLFNK